MVQLDCSHFPRENTNELSEALAKPASFKAMYFSIQSNGATTRDLLAYGDVEWTALSPSNWKAEKPLMPFHVMPVLYVTGQNGKEVTLAETVVIEHYLAEQFGLLGSNKYEESLIKMLHSSSAAIMIGYSVSVTWNQPEVKSKTLAYFTSSSLPDWIECHERHLRDNGNNGHYVGDKLSLADIRTANVIEHFADQPEAEALMALINKSEPLLKVREAVAKHPKLLKYKSGEAYKKLSENNRGFYADPMAFIF
ncbi:hypothetical protein FBU30_006592 [Linnemannia zychae]|nr:hypothetical protein FBU30_006592 [Linnemannia zychae]